MNGRPDQQLTALAHDPIGVTVTGLSVDAVDADVVVELRHLLAERGVVVLPNQPVDDNAFTAFLQRFGDLIFTKGETAVPGFPDLNVVSNVGRSTPPRSTFHIDTTYLRQPPTYTALRAVSVPERGGSTVFTNQYRAFDTLPDRLRSRLAGRTITHVVTGVEVEQGDETSAQHPVFAVHPISGRTSLYLSSPQRCAAISGLSAAETERTVQELFAHSTATINTWEHGWSAGDIVMWDNRCVLHRGDHSDVVGDRVLHRGTVLARGDDAGVGRAGR